MTANKEERIFEYRCSDPKDSEGNFEKCMDMYLISQET